MRRILSHIIGCLVITVAMVFFSGCTDETFGTDLLLGHSEVISLATSLDPIEGTGITRSTTDHLSIEEEVWPLEGKTAITRGTPTTTLADSGDGSSGSAGIVGFNYSGSTWNDSNSPWSSGGKSLDNINISFSSATLNTAVPWKDLSDKTSSDRLRIYAYAPYATFYSLVAHTSGVPTVTYTVPDAVADQKDLIVAVSSDVAADSKTTIPLNFQHALTAIQFKVDFACKVLTLQIKQAYGTGTAKIGDMSASAWSASGKKDFTAIDFGAGKDCAAGGVVTDGANTFMMIPQNLPDDATVVMTYKEGDETVHTLMASLKGLKWLPGKRITYTLCKTPPSYIYFDLALGSVSINGTSYSGKIRVSDGTIKAVSGTNSTNQPYYIYQSTSSNLATTGWSTTTVGEGTCSIPSYSEASCESKTWSEYITNNTSIADVINNWSTAASGRTSTPNYIHIQGDAAVDITIDNVWSSYHYNVGHRTCAGFLIGPGDNENYNTKVASLSNKYERVTLRLKGDNHFHNILYYGHPTNQTGANTAYFKITSAEGDGSTSGSLTVTVPTANFDLAGACTLLGSGDNDECPPCNDMYFNGGTIFVGSPIVIPDSNAHGVVGGGTNNHCDITINGGVLTSVAYSHGAAIGGGGGYSSNGGNGTVTINGGKVYAYQFGQSFGTAAIGGGSSYSSTGNLATITINGGEVYAESVGGVALGGGSSGITHGGSATITITGGTVTAKSKSGIMPKNGVSVSAGSSVGGGTGGITGNGGLADLTVTGGTLIAGSIGGGGSNGEASGYKIGSAVINISGSTTNVQGQFVMAKGSAAVPPSFTMSGGTIQNNLSSAEFVKTDGGAVYIDEGVCTITGGTIKNSSVTGKGGAIYLKEGTLTFNETSATSIIQDCSATLGGGAIYLEGGTVNIQGGTIDRCVSSTHGGALFVQGGDVYMTGGTITQNLSSDPTANGGGVYINRGSFTMSNGTISHNHARGNGGGVYVTSEEATNVTFSSGSITYNTADSYGGGICVIPSGENTATVVIGVAEQGESDPDLTNNNAGLAGGGLYAEGTNANVTIHSGNLTNNKVAAYVANPDVANEFGTVTLNGGNVTKVTITFDVNGGTLVSGSTTQNVVKNTNSYMVPPTVTPPTNYHLVGWNTEANGSGTRYANVNQNTKNFAGDITLYAEWESD